MSKYMKKKEAARNEAINWLLTTANDDMSMMELLNYQDHFATIGRRYGLIREFHENGII